jgi:hypothetical protein
MPKGIEAPDQVNENSIIDVDTAPFDVIEALPDFIKDKMKSSEEYQGRLVHQGNMAKINRPKVVEDRIAAEELGRAIEYPTEDINPDNVPF